MPISSLSTESSGIVFHLDTPLPVTGVQHHWAARGWIHSPKSPVRSLTLHVGEHRCAAMLRLHRPDVPQALPEIGSLDTGWELRASLPPGRHEFSFVAALEDGSQCVVWASHVRVQRSWPTWLVSPPPIELLAFQLGLHAAYPPRPVLAKMAKTYPSMGSRDLPRFSIVTPSFNQARWLEESIRSVLDQQTVSCRYYVQDGGSTDESVSILHRYSACLTGCETGPDRGQTDAIARGFAHTSGEPHDLMAWLNSDDFYLPGALAFVAGYFARHPEVDVVYGHRIIVDHRSCEIGRWFLPPHDDEVLRLYDFVPQETLFWRRRIWEKVGGVDPSFQFAMDWDLLLRFQAAGARIVRLPAFLACFRVHAEQKSTAQIRDTGQREIDALRRRTFGRAVAPEELLRHPRLLAYLRRSARTELLWRLGWRR